MLIHADESLDEICGVELLQPRRGYRFNLDAILLAHFAAPALHSGAGTVVDLGTGTGIVALVLARKFGIRGLAGLELQPRLLRFAQRNVRHNALDDQVSLTLGDLREVPRLFEPGSARAVVSNPPYGAPRAGLLNPDPEKATARHEVHCTLAEIVAACAHLLAPAGRLCLVYPLARLKELTLRLADQGFSLRRLRHVHSRGGQPAFRVLVEAARGQDAPCETEPPLIVHQAGQALTAEVARMVEGKTLSS